MRPAAIPFYKASLKEAVMFKEAAFARDGFGKGDLGAIT
jgi:hypothetical protein